MGPARSVMLSGHSQDGSHWAFFTLGMFCKERLPYSASLMASPDYNRIPAGFFVFVFVFLLWPTYKKTVFVPKLSKISRVILDFKFLQRSTEYSTYANSQLLNVFKNDNDEFLTLHQPPVNASWEALCLILAWSLSAVM